MKNLGIYIHIPFCKQKCSYCDFISFANKESCIEEYIKCLKKEITEQYLREEVQKYVVDTIYIGGGTPSFIDSKYIVEILSIIKDKFIVKDDCEITIEVNPGTVTKEKIIDYKKVGINRISIGLQSSNDKILKRIGRIHTYEDFLRTVSFIRTLGIENINVDLMIGLPNQTKKDVEKSLEDVILIRPNHVSVYSLIVEDGTQMKKWIDEEKAKLPSEKLERKMYWTVKNTLENAGYKHYEISNFAFKDQESKHNMNCWNQNEYIGFGLAAHSYLDNRRFCNTSNIEKYLQNIEEGNYKNNIEILEIQNEEDTKKEYMLLGLRKIEGINIQKFKNKFGENPLYIFRKELEKLVNDGLIEVDLNNIKLTNKGLDLANLVWEEFI